MELVGSQWVPEDAQWPPVLQRRSAGPADVQSSGHMASKAAVSLPESFKMDSGRIQNFQYVCSRASEGLPDSWTFSAEIVDLALSSMLLQAIRVLVRQEHGDLSSMTCSQLRYDFSRELSRPEWRSTFSLSSRSQSKFASLLALRITRRAPPEPISGSEETVNEDRAIRIARTIDCFIAINVNRHSPLFLMSLKRVREAVTKVLTNSLVMEQFEPPSAYRHGTTSSRVIGDETRNVSSGARNRELYALTMSELSENEDRMVRSMGLKVMEEDLRALVKRMKKIVGLNASVFKHIYTSRGMMLGS